jgi:hypothetical protein
MADIDISAVTRRKTFSGSAGVGPYACTFEITANTDIAVYIDSTLKTLTTHYTVSINANGTFSVTFTGIAGALPTGSNIVTVQGAKAIARSTEFSTGGDFLAATMNSELDNIVIFIQQVLDRADRSLKAHFSDDIALDMTLPAVATRASKYLAFDSSGAPVATAGTGSSAVISTFAETLLDDTSASAMRTTLELGTMATQAASGVAITGGSVTGITDLAIADGGTGASTAADAFAALKQAATDSATGVVELATQAEVDAGTDTTRVLTPNHNRITLGTEQATTSGTAKDFTGLPAGTRRVTINFAGVSTGGTSAYLIQLGDSGGIENTGYLSAAGFNGGDATSTAGFVVTVNGVAAALYHGTVTLTLEDAANFTWASTGVLYGSGGAVTYFSAGSKSLSAELTQVRVTTASGDTFDAGGVNITYER